MWGRWGTPQNFLLAFIKELWKTRKIKLLKKWTKIAQDIILCICVPKTTIIWGTVSDIQSEIKVFVILDHFLTLSHLTIQKIKILKKWKRYLDASSFQTRATKNTIIWCMLTQTWSVTDIIFCHFRPFFALLPHYWTWKSIFGKNVYH